MPFHYVTLPDIEQSVARPAVFKVLEQIFEITKLSKDTAVLFNGPSGQAKTPGTAIGDENRDAKFASDRFTFIEVTENYQPGALQETVIHAHEHPAVFLDEKLGLVLRPVYTTSDVVIQIRYRCNSQTEAERWMADMVLKTSAGRDINLHSVNYTYPLPYPFIRLIEDVWTLREAVDGYGDQFSDYVAQYASPRLTILGTQAGEMRHLAIRETQTRIQGLFDIAGIPEKPTKDNSSGTWEIAFSYKFSYQRPDAMVSQYPISVHNQFLPDMWLNDLMKAEDPMVREHHYSKSYEALSFFEMDLSPMSSRPPVPYIRMPEYDGFSLGQVKHGTATVLVALSFLDEDRRDLISLTDLDEFVIDEDILEFMYGEIPYMTKLYHSFISVSLFEDSSLVDQEQLEVTSDMMVRAKQTLDLRKTYHVRLAIVIDVRLLTWAAIERLGKYPKAFVKLLAAINELLKLNPDFIKLRDNHHIEPWELTYAYWVLTGGTVPVTNDYPWNDIIENATLPGNNGIPLFHGIDPKTIKAYRDGMILRGPTVQTTAVIVKRPEVQQTA